MNWIVYQRTVMETEKNECIVDEGRTTTCVRIQEKMAKDF